LFLEGSHAEQPKETPSPEFEAKAARVAQCFALVARGRVSALGDLYEATATDLFGYIRSIVGTSSDAEDVFQEVFARVAARGPKLAKVEKPLAYMFTIARNEAYACVTRRSTKAHGGQEASLFEDIAAPAGAEAALSPNEAAQALAELPLDQREAVVLKIYEGFTFAEIADVTEVSLNTAASRYRYGIAKLARLLGRAVRDAEGGS
jgi:RNA polymerase sigma-70 factor, ECF subfamily